MTQHEYDPEMENLDCSAVIADIWLLLDDECDSQARSRLQSHITTCRSCLEHYGIEKQLKELIGRKCGGEKASDGLRQRLTIELSQTRIVDGSGETTITRSTIIES